jgi:ABC-type amino acid transport substrate-binding protein
VAIFHDAVTKLMADGTYTKIIKTWHLESGAITESKINAAVS